MLVRTNIGVWDVGDGIGGGCGCGNSMNCNGTINW